MNSASFLKLPEEISIANVAEWKGKLANFMHEPSPLILDAEDLSRVDTSAIQLFAAFAKKVQNSDKVLQWQLPSNALKNTAQQLGMSRVLGLVE